MDVEKRLGPAMTAMMAWGNGDAKTLRYIGQTYGLANYDDLAVWIVKEIVSTYRECVDEKLRALETAPRLVAFETRNARRRGKSHLS